MTWKQSLMYNNGQKKMFSKLLCLQTQMTIQEGGGGALRKGKDSGNNAFLPSQLHIWYWLYSSAMLHKK